ncbi:MAG: hypothetical protein MI975_28415 [Cytophagales bacterium]|nr:hypothetical protein [Cytophagales bacterium]
MTIREELLKDFSKAQMIQLSSEIGPNQEAFDELIELFLSKDEHISKRAAWLVSHCFDKHPWLVEKHLEAIILNLRDNVNDPVKRNSVRILQFMPLPEALMGVAAETCFRFLNSGKEAIAIKANSMTILFNIVKIYPELKEELKLSIEDQMPFGSAGFKSRGAKILKALENL